MIPGDFHGDGPCSGPGATHHDACACRERAKAELREAARAGLLALEREILIGRGSALITIDAERLRKALEATKR